MRSPPAKPISASVGVSQSGLNLADCFSYALAKSRGVPLLFKGDDFSQTDVAPAWRP
jgi:ribonuclease VapC